MKRYWCRSCVEWLKRNDMEPLIEYLCLIIFLIYSQIGCKMYKQESCKYQNMFLTFSKTLMWKEISKLTVAYWHRYAKPNRDRQYTLIPSLNKKVLLRERKRHTACRVAVASACYCGGGGSLCEKIFSSLNMYQAKSGVKNFSLY